MARAAVRPVLTTLHGRLDLPEHQPLYRYFRDVSLVSISDAQRRPVLDANWLATIYHGIELGEFTLNPQMAGYVAFLGRISRDKGPTRLSERHVGPACRYGLRRGCHCQTDRMPTFRLTGRIGRTKSSHS